MTVVRRSCLSLLSLLAAGTALGAARPSAPGAARRCPHHQWLDGEGVCRALTTCTGAQYESEPPAVAWGYELQMWGTCQFAIDSATECEHAARVLGVVDTTAQDDLQPLGVVWDPEGCYFESGRLKHHLYGANTGLCSDTDKCLCRSRSHYISDRTCAVASTCAAGTFESRPPTASSDRACKSLTQCAHGMEYVSAKPRHAWAWALITEGVCERHVASSEECNAAARFLGLRDQHSEADRQPHGVSWDPSGCYLEFGFLKHHLQMRNTGKCSKIDNCLCRTRSYKTSDRVCSPLTTCSARQYQIAAPGHAVNRVCADLTTCDAGSQYQTVAPTATSDRQCADLTTCDEGAEYEARGATATSDRACSALTKCAADQFEAAPPTQRWRFVRQTWGRCEQPIETGHECGRAAMELGLHDASAEDDKHRFGVSWDPDGCYYENGRLKHHSYGLNSGACSPTDQCLCRGDSYAAGDRACQQATKCSAAQFEARPPTATSDRICEALTECKDGEYEAAAPIPIATAATAASAAADVRRLGAAATPTHHFEADRQCQAHRSRCKAGTYETVAPGAQNDRKCMPCPPGTAQPKAGQGQCVDCSEQVAGAFADTPGQVNCAPFEPCPAGAVRSGTSSVSGGGCTACPAGRAKASAGRWSDECLPCLAGQFAPTAGSSHCTDCEAGTFQQWTGRLSCTRCPLGRFAPTAARSAEAHCLLCPTGKFAAQKGTVVCSACSAGRFGSVGASVTHAGHCIMCPKGKFQAADGLTSCGHCPSGKYQHKPEQRHCHSCSEPNAPFTLGKIDELHFYWTANRAGEHACVPHPLDCLPSSWGAWSACDRSCGTGTTRRDRTQAYQSWGGGKPCADFEWQQEKDCATTPCPVDCVLSSWAQWTACTRSCGGGSVRRARSVTTAVAHGGRACKALLQTKACNEAPCPVDCKVNAWGAWGPCTKACGNGRKTRNRLVTAPLLGGKACPAADDEAYCNSQCCAGTYHSHGLECKHCSSGTFAAQEGAMWCQRCAKGQYQEATGKKSCHNCPPGTHQPLEERTSKEHCVQCQLGQYQPAASSHACIACNAGRFNDKTGSSKATACEACKAGKVSPAPGSSACEKCDVGKYQRHAGQATCTPCEAGRFSKLPGSHLEEYCYDCTCGMWSSAGANVCATCPAGRFRAAKRGQSVASCAVATKGHAATEGACAQSPCPAGHFQDAGEAATCKACPAGRHSSATGAAHASACEACLAGTWAATGASHCTQCGAGHFSAAPALRSSKACKACTAGWYNTSPGATTCKKCESGRWQARSAARTCTNCAAGTANPQRGASSAAACAPCARGMSQAAAGQAVCTACAVGTYSESSGSVACTRCEHGTANAATGATRAAACAPCSAGSYAQDTGSARCILCALGKYSQHAAATSAVACVHCAAGQYADSLGQAACKKCASGRFGQDESGASRSMVHCLKCPAGKFQQADGMLECAECESGQFTASYHDMVQCEACAKLDEARRYDTRGMAGQSSCQPVPLDCLPSAWGAWSQCSRSCGGGGKRTRTRQPARQPAAPALCGLAEQSQCTQAWGGGLPCDSRQWSSTGDCNPHPCPVDCVVSVWGAFEPCTKTCGTGGTKRVRAITSHAKHGGKGCPVLRDPVQGLLPCNTHECGWHALPSCHLSHVRCNVLALSHPNSRKKRPDLPGCGWSVIEDQNTCWNNHNCVSAPSQVCHDADDDGEKELGDRLAQQYAACMRGGNTIRNEARAHFGAAPQTCRQRFGTLVVTHDRAAMQKSLAVQRNAFHCEKTSVGCGCTCRKHPPCCSHARKVLGNAAIRGATYRHVPTMQDCCDMCTNHPHCTSWEYSRSGLFSGDGVCALKVGAPQWAASSDGARLVWSGTHSGAAC